jgi:hypothetical protein
MNPRYTFYGLFTLVSFVSETIGDSDTQLLRQSHDCTCLGHLGQHDTDRIISIWVMSPKVAEASTIVTVMFCCRWHFCLKISPLETQLYLVKNHKIDNDSTFT